MSDSGSLSFKRQQTLFNQNKLEIESNHKALSGVITNKRKYRDTMYKIPNFNLRSSIVSFKTWTQIWKLLPTYVQIRKTEKIFESAEDGYNIQTLFMRSKEFLYDHNDKGGDIQSYHYCLILIQT